MLPSSQESAKPYVVVKQPGQEVMIARALDSPQNIPSSFPVAILATSTHAGICTACQTCEAAVSSPDTAAQPQSDGSAFHQRAQIVSQVDSPDQADSALPELPRMTSTGRLQPPPEPADQDGSMGGTCEALNVGLPVAIMVCEPSHSMVYPPASQQEETSRSLAYTMAASELSASTSRCKECSRGMPVQGHESKIDLSDIGDDQVACMMRTSGLGRRSSRHSLSTRESCVAFLADTTSLLDLQAGRLESTTVLGSAPVQLREPAMPQFQPMLAVDLSCVSVSLKQGPSTSNLLWGGKD